MAEDDWYWYRGGSSSSSYYSNHGYGYGYGSGGFFFAEMVANTAATRRATADLKLWLNSNLASATQSHFGSIAQDVIASPGFNSRVDTFCNLILDEAENYIPQMTGALYIPGVRHSLLKLIKGELKEVLVLLLVASGSTHDDAVSFVNNYVSDEI